MLGGFLRFLRGCSQLGRCQIPASRAKATDLDRRLLGLEIAFFLPHRQTFSDDVVVELFYLAACLTDRKNGHATAVAVAGVAAGDEGIDTFEAMDLAERQEFFQCAIDLKRGPETIVTKPFQDRVGANGLARFFKDAEHQSLILRELFRYGQILVANVVSVIRLSLASPDLHQRSSGLNQGVVGATGNKCRTVEGSASWRYLR